MIAEIIQKELILSKSIIQNKSNEELEHLKKLYVKYRDIGFTLKAQEISSKISQIEGLSEREIIERELKNCLLNHLSAYIVLDEKAVQNLINKYNLRLDSFSKYNGFIPECNLDKIISYKSPITVSVKRKNVMYGERINSYFLLTNFVFRDLPKTIKVIGWNGNHGYNEEHTECHLSKVILADKQSFVIEDEKLDPIVFEKQKYSILTDNGTFNFNMYVLITMWGAEQILPEIAEFYKHLN